MSMYSRLIALVTLAAVVVAPASGCCASLVDALAVGAAESTALLHPGAEAPSATASVHRLSGSMPAAHCPEMAKVAEGEDGRAGEAPPSSDSAPGLGDHCNDICVQCVASVAQGDELIAASAPAGQAKALAGAEELPALVGAIPAPTPPKRYRLPWQPPPWVQAPRAATTPLTLGKYLRR